MSDTAAIKALVVDDHDLLRQGVCTSLSGFADIDVVADASSGELALTRVAEFHPDVVVIDLVMPGMGGVEAIRQLRAGDPDLGIVALSSFSEGERVREVLDAGANGYLVKSVDAASLARAVRSAAAGQSSFSPEVMTALTETPTVDLITALTAREQEIAGLIAEGRTNAEIAHELSLSIFTVKNHVSSILMKLQVQTRTEAAAVIFRSQTGRAGQ
jgi:NarL family two-component system response regulator LiaR